MIMPVMHSEWVDCIMLSLRILGAFMILLLSAAYLTYVERKMIAADGREILERKLASCTTDPRLAEGMYYAYLEEGNWF